MMMNQLLVNDDIQSFGGDHQLRRFFVPQLFVVEHGSYVGDEDIRKSHVAPLRNVFIGLFR